MRISHEAIYQALYIKDRGGLNREPIRCLRTGRALRKPRARTRRNTWRHVTPETLLRERPAEADDRAVTGHLEGDLIIGLERSAIGTLVDRTTRFTIVVHLPTRGWLPAQAKKQERSRARRPRRNHNERCPGEVDGRPSYRAEAVADLGPWRRNSVRMPKFTAETDTPVYFADPKSPWQRGTNENTNGLLR